MHPFRHIQSKDTKRFGYISLNHISSLQKDKFCIGQIKHIQRQNINVVLLIISVFHVGKGEMLDISIFCFSCKFFHSLLPQSL